MNAESEFARLRSVLGIVDTGEITTSEDMEPQDDESVVLIRTPLCRKKVFHNELASDMWSATRSFLITRYKLETKGEFSSMFVDFWAIQVIKNMDANKTLQHLKESCRLNSGINVNEVSETVQDFIRVSLEHSVQEIVDAYSRYRDLILSSKAFTCSRLNYAIAATRNNRTHMEDCFLILDKILHPHCQKIFSIFMVFDGHNGAETAYFASKHLPFILLSDPNPFNQFAIREAFLKVQTMLDKRYLTKESISGGTTVVMLLIVDNICYLTWLGDSVAYAVKDQRIVYKTSSHKPNRRDEFDRIIRLGGCVTRGATFRINGITSVSRSLGDNILKPLVSHEPEQHIFGLDKADAFVLASDGLADFCSDDELLNALYRTPFDNHETSKDDVCQSLIKIAQSNGSNDNIMAILIFTNDWPLCGGPLVPAGGDQTRSPSYTHEFITDFNRPLSAIIGSTKTIPEYAYAARMWKTNVATNSVASAICDDGTRPYSNLV